MGRTSLHGDVAVTLTRARVAGSSVEAEVEYAVDGRRWRQAFAARMLTEAELVSDLRAVGLGVVEWLDADRSWSRARPCDNRDR